MRKERTFKIASWFLWNMALGDCANLYISELKLDSYFSSKYPENNMCQSKHNEEGELALLEKKYEEILSSDPTSNTFSQLADILCKQGKVDKAIGVLVQGLVHNKNNATARFMLGKIYYDRWLIEQAKKEMEKVLEISPDNVEAAKLLSQIYRSEDMLDKALTTLEGVFVFHRDDNILADEINQINASISEKESEQVSRVFETPIESRKINEVKLNDSTSKDELYTETMLSIYIEQGEYDMAREVIEKIYDDESQRNSAIEKLKKTKLNKMNSFAGFESGD